MTKWSNWSQRRCVYLHILDGVKRVKRCILLLPVLNEVCCWVSYVSLLVPCVVALMQNTPTRYHSINKVATNPLHIVWRYIVMQLSYHFQNIVKISLSHFFWTISHDIYLISTHTESPYWWIKVPIGEAIFRWKWHKKSKYTPHKWSLTGKYRFPKKL